MTCCIDIIILPRGLGKPYIVVRDVPSRRTVTHILTESLGDYAGSIPVCFLFLFQRVGNDVVSCCEFRSRVSRKLGSNWLLSLVSHTLTKTLGSIDEDIVSSF